MSNFDRALEHLMEIEGGYVNDPDDRGGATRFGITEEVARRYGYEGDMTTLPFEIASQIAKEMYWDVISLDVIANLDYRLAYEIFEAGYNCGVNRVAKWVQQSLNSLNKNEKLYPELLVDGIIGPVTIDAIKDVFEEWQGKRIMRTAVNVFQGQHYFSIARRNKTQERFLWGWLKRVNLGEDYGF